MSSHTFEQFIRFTTDSAQILSSYPALLGIFISLLEFSGVVHTPPSYAKSHAVLVVLRQRLGLARRFFRLFRFLDSFHAAQRLYTSIAAASEGGSSSEEKKKKKKRPFWVHLEAYLDVFGRTFNGMYLLLESSTIVDALQIDGLRAWSPGWERTVAVEAQRFWLFSLVCSVLSGVLKALQVLAYTPVPPAGDVTQSEKTSAGAAAGDAQTGEKDKENQTSGTTAASAADFNPDEEFDVRKEQERLKGLVQKTRKRRRLWMREVKAKLRGLGRAVAANALDIVLPGVFVGWIDADPGTVGVVMFITTVLTGMEVWERCGREVSQGK
ncbi:hypothetical protein G7054_g94 [Neopestalotiopsis clavispora]|nr:hypothetical protein G7054_g94 [Neopestalotiopsis clavispora]